MPPAITIYRGSSEPGYVWSPFVTKLEARLRFASIPYKKDTGSPKSAPKGKIPYVEIAEDAGSTSMGDSTLIIKHLVQEGILPDLNASLAPAERGHDTAVKALLEEKVYFYNAHERWTQNYYSMRDHALSPIPYPLRIVIGLLVYRSIVTTLHGQGTGRFSDEEVHAFRTEAWSAVNDILVASKAKTGTAGGADEKPFWVLGGENPSEADSAVFGFVVSSLLCDAGPKTRELVKGFPVVVEYARRIHDAYFPDYEKFAE